MLKEIIISITILISIISLDFVTQNYAKESVEEVEKSLQELKGKIEVNSDELQNNINEVFEIWEKRYSKLAFFIEHDELEKVATKLTNLKSFIKVKDFDMAVSSIDEAHFVLMHIKDKNAFELKNIF